MKNLTINVGDYVRNKYGIAKVVDIENKNDINILRFDRDIAFMIDREENKELYRSNYLPLTEDIDINKINFSSNIIDLIEVGDYVNGEKIIRKLNDTFGRRILIYGFDDGKHQVANAIYEEDIKSIVTKEMFESLEYKIER